MKIHNSKALNIGQTKAAVDDSTLPKEKTYVCKDEFIQETNVNLSYAFRDRDLRSADFLLDISCNVEEKTASPWWTEELKVLLPPLPNAPTVNESVASAELLSLLKSIANDKSYLAVNLCEEFNK